MPLRSPDRTQAPFSHKATLVAAKCVPDEQWSRCADQLMTIGVYYYPEAWPEAQWEAPDIANIKKLASNISTSPNSSCFHGATGQLPLAGSTEVVAIANATD